MVLGHADRAAARPALDAGPHPADRRARARLVDARRRRRPGLVLDDELPERRPELRPDELHVGDYFQHDWYATTFSQLAMVTLLIVWGALPFVAITLYAGLAQVPRELVEAAADRRRGPAGGSFRDVTLPMLKPILLILTSLSIIWDFGVFTQPYLLIGASHVERLELPDGRLRLHRGLRALRLRARRGDLDPDAADRRGAERRLRPPDGADGGDAREHAARGAAGAARRAAGRSAGAPGTSSGSRSSSSSCSRSSGWSRRRSSRTTRSTA